MLTWRYHLMTLVAVFLALGLGVLVGISLSDSGVVETGSANLVDDIQEDLDELNSRNDALAKEKAINLRFQDDTFPFLVGGHLQGKKVAVVSSSTVSDEVLRDLSSAVNSAGGQIISTTRLNSHFDTAATTERLSSAMAADPAFSNINGSTIATVLGQQLAADIGKAGGPALLETLRGTLVDSTSGSYITPVNAVLVITNADNEQAPEYVELEKQLILGLRDLGVRAAGAEPSDAPISEIPIFISAGISSVDNIESRVGQVSIVRVLGGENGSFGVKTTADLLIPILRAPR